MGKIIKINPDDLYSTQDHIKKDAVNQILITLVRGETKNLPPIPIVKETKGKLIVLDGHSLLCVYSMLGKECEVYVANKAKDTIDSRKIIDFGRKPVMTIKKLRLKYISKFDIGKDTKFGK